MVDELNKLVQILLRKKGLNKTFDDEKANKDKKKGRPESASSASAKADNNNDDNLDSELAIPTMSMEERMSQPLYIKIENILPRIYVSCTTNAYKEKWEWPQVDPFTGLYIDKNKKKAKIKKMSTSKNLLEASSSKVKPNQIAGKSMSKKQLGSLLN